MKAFQQHQATAELMLSGWQPEKPTLPLGTEALKIAGKDWEIRRDNIGDLVQVGETGELADGTMKEALAKGREILLARIGDEYYAADNRCPHMGVRLSQGKLEGTVVTCPRHGSQFDITDGGVERWLKGSGLISKVSKALKSPRPLVIYSVKVEDNRILIEI